MVYRIFVEKKRDLANEAAALADDIRQLLQINSLMSLRLFNRYDVENIDENLFEECKKTVFSESQLDDIYSDMPVSDGDVVFAVEFLPGQFDQRADSAAQCIQLISRGNRPAVRMAKVYLLQGALTPSEVEQIKKYVINPVECREASLEKPITLNENYSIPSDIAIVEGFTEMSENELSKMVSDYGFAMDKDDLAFCREYFRTEKRDPTLTELRMIDTYWSDHCRHTTFLTAIDSVEIDDPTVRDAYDLYLSLRESTGRKERSRTFMDIATIAAKELCLNGKLTKMDESEEINACTVKVDIECDGVKEPWLLLFKNETHNHPTEIEPFGGAATCIGGAIRDPLSGRSYVYAAMRVTGAGDPRIPVGETPEGKLPQRKIVTSAAAGYSSYGNQIGLATGSVNEIYHPGYVAKRMEIGAVLGAAPEKNVVRQTPEDGDVVILLGGRTGRDGCGGATGSSKAHNSSSLSSCGAEVQKGNAPEERKLQRLFRNPDASRMIKRCNDFGAGGVSVAIGELADGLDIDLDRVPKKYDGLDGTELAISESQERMAVVVKKSDAEKFSTLAATENLEATVVAHVTALPRLVMHWRGKKIVDISRDFLNSNGAEKHTSVKVGKPSKNFSDTSFASTLRGERSFEKKMTALLGNINICSEQGLSERFDSTIGAATVLMPFGGKNQITPPQAMAHRFPLRHGHTDDCSVMSWGFNPFISECSPYHGAYLAVVESLSKLIATGADRHDTYLTFQEYFERLRNDPSRWGKPFSSLLGALKAQVDFSVASIGGKDSMSGTFEDLDVPPTLVSFAVTTTKIQDIISPEFKVAGRKVVWLRPEYSDEQLPNAESLIKLFDKVTALIREQRVASAYSPVRGGVAEGIAKMCFGNDIGFKYAEDPAITDDLSNENIFSYAYGSFILELTDDDIPENAIILGQTTENQFIECDGEKIPLASLKEIYNGVLEGIYPMKAAGADAARHVSYCKNSVCAPAVKIAKPRVLIPVFPGTNCEYDSARAMEDAGAETEIFVLRNLTPHDVEESVSAFAAAVKRSNMIFVPGGFSGGDEPDGSGKFIMAFFRNESVQNEITSLLDVRDGLMCGICNGFQALIKLGLVPYGRITEPSENSPTLTYNTIGRHQSKLVRVRVASNLSPWLSETNVGDIYTLPISHGEGRFYADEATVKQHAKNGQIATQYCDINGNVNGDIVNTPSGAMYAIEGITSPDGRVFGRMGHMERCVDGLYKNVPGIYGDGMFRSAVKYFK